MEEQNLPANRTVAGEFRIGRVLSRALSVFQQGFLPFVLVTGIARLGVAFEAGPPRSFQNVRLADLRLVDYVALFVFSALALLAQVIVINGTFEVMSGRPINLGGSAKVGLQRFFPIICLGIVVWGLNFVFVIWTAVLGVLSLRQPGIGVPMIGMILLAVPAVLLSMWLVAMPVCVAERLGVVRSLGRSRELTKGNRWRIFGLVVLMNVPVLIIAPITTGVMGSAAAAAYNAALVSTAGKIAIQIWVALWIAFSSIVVAVAYHGLRLAKGREKSDADVSREEPLTWAERRARQRS